MNNYWNGKQVLVTGCVGFLGSWLTKSLVEHGANVVGLYRNLYPTSLLHKFGLDRQINLIRGSLEDRAVIERIVEKYRIETIFHLGAQTDVQVAFRNPIDTFQSNIMGTCNILEVARRSSGVKQVIVASSDKAYGTVDQLPYTEEMTLSGRFPYDVSKSATDLITQSYYHTFGTPTAITRCGNLYGGGDLNFTRIVPGVIKSIIHNQQFIIRSDGTFTRDYLYVKDAVNAYLCLAEGMEANTSIHGQAFNFSSDKPYTVLELFREIARISGRTVQVPLILNEANHEIRNQHLSSGKAGNILGWTAEYNLKDSLEETFKWYSEFLE
ncbi:GDP-mannose 4,6-dehydratase [Paenibacillus polymyxa]|uniref:GDP-mannose 4,6-dehydratase n=1 Tax=Paenibacillus polymyxa TaxID=1406 RepID=UPI001BE80FD8|nr:GDP-mannose 4,6-dehydratase [Paenibacillus polymyxa]MBT2282957.1 GDP-mannose 4,6-dehydratase [Paenibacillus polymyxa]